MVTQRKVVVRLAKMRPAEKFSIRHDLRGWSPRIHFYFGREERSYRSKKANGTDDDKYLVITEGGVVREGWKTSPQLHYEPDESEPNQSAQVTEKLERYQKDLEFRQRVAANNPSDNLAQFALVDSIEKVGSLQQKQKQYEQAIETYGRELRLLQSMKEQKRLTPTNEIAISRLDQFIQQCRHSATAMGDWKTLLEQPADLLPVLLEMRGTQFVQEDRADDAALAVAKLRDLGTATAGQLYNAACVYSLCAAGIKAEKDELTAEQDAERQKHITDALETLREAIKAGWKDFAHMQEDPGLRVLRDLPEFKALLPHSEPDEKK